MRTWGATRKVLQTSPNPPKSLRKSLPSPWSWLCSHWRIFSDRVPQMRSTCTLAWEGSHEAFTQILEGVGEGTRAHFGVTWERATSYFSMNSCFPSLFGPEPTPLANQESRWIPFGRRLPDGTSGLGRSARARAASWWPAPLGPATGGPCCWRCSPTRPSRRREA